MDPAVEDEEVSHPEVVADSQRAVVEVSQQAAVVVREVDSVVGVAADSVVEEARREVVDEAEDEDSSLLVVEWRETSEETPALARRYVAFGRRARVGALQQGCFLLWMALICPNSVFKQLSHIFEMFKCDASRRCIHNHHFIASYHMGMQLSGMFRNKKPIINIGMQVYLLLPTGVIEALPFPGGPIGPGLAEVFAGNQELVSSPLLPALPELPSLRLRSSAPFVAVGTSRSSVKPL